MIKVYYMVDHMIHPINDMEYCCESVKIQYHFYSKTTNLMTTKTPLCNQMCTRWARLFSMTHMCNWMFTIVCPCAYLMTYWTWCATWYWRLSNIGTTHT